ncbi:MAG: DMT family transporter [Chloroflexi bacterium]|jgi:drug/metabolite transporter (DMT)-like permease|nr:MAG: hypothetical protein UZ13_03146 [Chloroflexi bacterium OLB13]MBC6955667.1 DMT family transporter [Chloroflexota bacterium]MBV6435223.1 putative cystine transporter YijE [Anaerolineae bacterium]OQY82694.1 MAG: hypothetical protein B6D42_08910 [Anaerolineae bacterium UTCFX5]MBW7878913.1 DMT family transporter [Anaerolineae bacterium]
MVRGAVYGLTAAAIWGGMYVVSDVVLPVIPPFTLLTLRLVLGGAVLLGLLAYQRRNGNGPAFPHRADLPALLGVGIIGFGVSIGAQFVGTDLSTAINGSVVTSASPAFIVLFAALILRERLTVRRVLAVGLASVGVLLILDLSQANFSSDTFRGDVSLAVAAVTWALYSVLVRRVSRNRDTLVVTLAAFAGGLFLTAPAALIESGTRPIGEITPAIVLGVLYLGVISTAVAMWMWNRAFALVDASVASLFFFAQPVVGAALSVILLGQPLTVPLIAGSVLIAAGVLLALRG